MKVEMRRYIRQLIYRLLLRLDNRLRLYSLVPATYRWARLSELANENKGPVITSSMSLAGAGSFTLMSRRTQLSRLAYAKYQTVKVVENEMIEAIK